jgi:dephospho-CoA kinase
MRLIGLTGGIATGKTSVGKFLASKYDVPVLNVDDVSKSVTATGSPVLQEIVNRFGKECLKDDGSLNRNFLRGKIITDKESAKALEGIVIPAITSRIMGILQEYDEAGKELVFVENAVMIEKGTYKNYDEILVVTCSEETQLKRLISRDNQTEVQARGMISLQMPLKSKESMATYLIRNDTDVETLEAEVDRVWLEISENSNE